MNAMRDRRTNQRDRKQFSNARENNDRDSIEAPLKTMI